LKEGDDWFEPALNIHTPLSPTLIHIFFYLPLFNSIAKIKLFLRVNSIVHSSRYSKTRLSLQQLTFFENFYFEMERNGK
jgi:hypothetical protein